MNIDFLNPNASQGDVANSIKNGLQINRMRPYIGNDGKTYVTVHVSGDKTKPESYKKLQVNADGTLRRDEWKMLDDAVIGVARNRLTGIQDLKTMGLVYNLGNAMGTTVLESHTMSGAFEAELTMDGISKSKGDRTVNGTIYLPIPIIHADYNVNARVLAASRNMGNPLDTSNAELAAAVVSEKLEDLLFTDTQYSFGGGTIYSYLNHPNRKTLSIGTAWDSSGVTGKDIVESVLTMKQKMIQAKKYGPYILYIPTNYETIVDGDYDTTTPGTTIRERILKIAGIKEVKVADHLTSDNVVMVNMDAGTVRLVNGMEITNLQWQSQGGMTTDFKVMCIQVPQIRADYDGNCGVVHMS